MGPRLVRVDLTNQWGEYARPGILIARRKVNDRGTPKWEAWVIHSGATAPAHGENVHVYQGRVDMALIRPVDAERPKPDLSGFRPVNGSTGLGRLS